MRQVTLAALCCGCVALGCSSQRSSTKTNAQTMAAGSDAQAMAGTNAPAMAGGAMSMDVPPPPPQTGAPPVVPATGPADYANPDIWLCRPGRADACAIDLATTVIAADGTMTPEPYAAAADAPIDCFYVYPTVSLDPTSNSDLVAGPEERNVIASQFARFGSQCRLFAPLYRQVTLTALRASLSGMAAASPPDRALGYNDVVAAWRHYLENDNMGRGVVLIGHSQGSGVLTQLIREQLDTMPLDARLIAALLIGTSVGVPSGADVGGTFQQLPLCRADDQLGCVITYASFRATSPPPAGALFGRARDASQVAGCTNPAAIGGGSGELHSYLSTKGSGASSTPPAPWTSANPSIATPFVSVPGLLSAQCVANENGSYLEITVHGDPQDARVDEITGDVVTNGMVSAGWGLHLIDMNLTMGNLIDQVKAKSDAYLAR
jgi:hypothetical protein